MKPKPRIGKIARLPLEIREQLNRRLQNGETGSSILKWLNGLPETIAILAEQFAAQPINKQNLSDWRHGGYQDWLRHQDRKSWAQRVCEQGNELEAAEIAADAYDNFSRIMLAEMSEDLEHLHDMTNRKERWKQLREMCRELARLQNSFNHSKRVELEWQKRNDKYEDTEAPAPCSRRGNEAEKGMDQKNPPPHLSGCKSDAQCVNSPSETQTVNPSQAESSHAATGQCLNLEERGSVSRSAVEKSEHDWPFLSALTAKPLRVADPRSVPCGQIKALPATVNPPPKPKIETVIRAIRHRQCGYGCVCKDCHPDDGEYPYAQALKDSESKEPHSSDYWLRGDTKWLVFHTDCDCYCGCEKSLAWDRIHPGSAGLSAIALAAADVPPARK